MKILTAPCYDTHEVKGSKFLTYFEPFSYKDNVKIRQSELRAMHPKAVHVVYASRVLNEFHQIVENQSDDKEPKNSSGAPTLNVLRGAEVVNCVCYVVRYFGGTLLGVGGLVRAYSLAANLGINKAISENKLIDYVKKQNYKISINYSEVNKLDYILEKLEISYHKDYKEIVDFHLELSDDEFLRLSVELQDSLIDIIKLD